MKARILASQVRSAAPRSPLVGAQDQFCFRQAQVLVSLVCLQMPFDTLWPSLSRSQSYHGQLYHTHTMHTTTKKEEVEIESNIQWQYIEEIDIIVIVIDSVVL
eukprot:m.76698 g.76698  ORF g.76698 m.76698 type:complete len:103 (-) comp11894_c0_seq3:411-719(-)